MAFDHFENNPGLRLLITFAAICILVQGLRFGQPVLLPFVMACVVAVVCLPVVFWLAEKRVPLPVAIFLTVSAAGGVVVLLVFGGIQQIRSLQSQVPTLVTAVAPRVDGWLNQIEAWAPIFQEGQLRATVFELLNAATLAALATGATTWVVAFLSNIFLVLLILAFALAETRVFPQKMSALAVDDSDNRYRKIVDEVQGYLVIKTLVSLATGALLGFWTWTMGLELPVLMGLIAFVFNFVPTIGSILASLPAIALALLQIAPGTTALAAVDFQHALVVGLGYLVVNVVIGNWLEPMLMGRRLGISTLVVVVSLVFWGWLWGPVGALLSVPLTMVVKIFLENTKDLRWIAVLLDKDPPEATAMSATATSGTAAASGSATTSGTATTSGGTATTSEAAS